MFTRQRVFKVVLVGLLAFIGVFSLPPVPPAHAAAALVVNGLGDTIAADGACTLREAITAANTNLPVGDCPAGTSGADMISFSVTGTITLTSQLPDISESLMISGPGADRLTISGNHAVGVLHVAAGSVMLADLTIADGISQSGGGILNEAMLSISHSVFRSNGLNGTNGSIGGAIFNQSMLMVADSTFSGNSTGSDRAANGGAIYNASGADAVIMNSTFTGNIGANGGAIYNAGSLTAIACTFASNTVSWRVGGAIYNDGGVVTVRDSTFWDNYVDVFGNAIYSYGGLLSVTNSTFAGNGQHDSIGSLMVDYGTLLLTNSTFSETFTAFIIRGGAATIKNTIISALYMPCVIASNSVSGSNNRATDANCGPVFTQTTTSALKLGPLQDNGGVTKTVGLLSGSVAIDAGDAATCAAMPVSNRDQRGIPRTLGRNCDIGAVEMSDPIVCTSPGAITSTSASWFSDPVATLSTSPDKPDEVVLRKELGAFSRYGAADGRADLVNTGQQATWHFTLPASIDPAQVRSAYFQLALVADDHLGVDLSKYALSLWTNGDVRVAGCPAALPHGAPSFLPFSNWVRQGYLTSVGSASYTITLANRSTTGKTDWEGVDWIELHLLLR